MEKKKVWIVGHKNPDTDSICAAIAYAELKNKIAVKERDENVIYVPKRAGEINAETAYVLTYFGVKPPSYIDDVGTQLKDIAFRRTPGVKSSISMKKAWELMKELDEVTLPVINSNHKLVGIIVTGDIAQSYMDVYDNAILSTARTCYRNIVETLSGKVITGNERAYFTKGKVVIGTGSAEIMKSMIEPDDLVILSDREESQMLSLAEQCSCMIVCNGVKVNERVALEAEKQNVVLISTPYDTFTVARLINQSMPIRYFMTKEDIIFFELDDYVNDVREMTAKTRHRDYPLLDENHNYVGMFSGRNLLNMQKKQVILVDHNEKTQAVNNIEEAEILEIIDHHRLGSLETIEPVYFRNQPLGCTSTIIYQIYQEQGIVICEKIAGILCAAIISDTLMFRSPTCTQVDVMAAKALAKIADIDIEEFAYHMFEAGSDFERKTEEEILNQDFKIFYSMDISFGVAQISAMGEPELIRVRKRVEPKLPTMRGEKKVAMLFIMFTDIMMQTTTLVYYGEDAKDLIEEAFEGEIVENSIKLENVVSRKKQLIPALMNALARRQW